MAAVAGAPAAAHDPAGAALLGPDAIWWNGTGYRTILPSERTGGALSITDGFSPAGSGPPRHVHAAEDETFVVLSGQHRVWVEGETFEVGPGEAVFVPRGANHTFQILGGEPGRHLVILTPGGFEGFFVEMARGGYRIPEDMRSIGEVAARYALTFTGPPLAADE